MENVANGAKAAHAAAEEARPRVPSPYSKEHPLVLRGYIRKAGPDRFEGICLNLNLAVVGESVEDVEKKLRDLILAYLEDVANDGSWDDFVPRRAPLSYYFTFYWYMLLAELNAITDFRMFVESAPTCTAHA